MTAASVTGVGQGSADKAGQRGSENLFVGVEKLIGTRVVESGYANIASGGTTAIVVLPKALPGVWSGTFDGTSSASDYVVFVTPYTPPSPTAAFYVASMTSTYTNAASTGGSNHGFTITASASQTVSGGTTVFWQVVRITGASVTSYPIGF